MTKFFKNSKRSPIKSPEPRKIDEINKEYSDLIGKLGIEEFRAHIQMENIKNIKQRLYEVNAEANERTALDTKNKPAEEVKETKNE